MILSVSRRTDIPAFYGAWFIDRLKDGKFYVKNPYNENVVSLIEVNSDNLDCIVFWTKDAINFMQYLNIINELNYEYYFHYTINPYHNEIEPLKHSKNDIIENFIELSNLIGKERVILRYNPIIMSEKYSINYHLHAFKKLCSTLKGKTEKIVISSLDNYSKINKILKNNALRSPNNNELAILCQKFKEIAFENEMELTICADQFDASEFGINKNSCIDKKLIERITNKKVINDTLDKTRAECLCLKCIDIGAYNTCQMGCVYCYAGYKQIIDHDFSALLLNDEIKDKEIKVRKDVKSILESEKQIIFEF